MDAGNIAIYGLGGAALAGLIAIFLPKILGRSDDTKLLDRFKKDQKQEQLQTEVKEITKEEQVIAAQIKASENTSEETKKKVKEKLQKAAVEIQEVLKKDNLSAIDSQIDEDWKGI
jgi:galactokinase/mevalonate kinase-like predicted kinase